MRSLPIPEDERDRLSEDRALSTDQHGDEILVGLTRDESVEYLELAIDVARGRGGPEVGERFLSLHAHHEAARISVAAGESELRDGHVSRH